MNALMTVPFHGTNLFIVEHHDEPFVPMRPIVEGMGMAWQPQHRKLVDRFETCITHMVTQLPGDDQAREVVCLPLKKLPAWMYSVNPKKVDESIRQTIIDYQNECDDALWAYWNDGYAVNHRAQPPAANDESIPIERRLPVAADNFDAAKRIAESLGLEGNQAILSANNMVRSAIGVDVMEMAGVKRLINESQELNYTPTELGAKFGMSAVSMNKLLADCGLQHQVIYKPGKKRWEVTPDGKLFAVITDTGKKHSDGKPVQQILWKESVQEMLARLADQLRSGLPAVIAGGVTR
ncbi:phage antirepressor N-terminal domain-containing protein [Pseudomonas chlororaphis]|uniref:phage antirepressor N-terminal domain-containing protein n=1 Tax=Pseudomonas chlororaphis TaxID=587753 RepID=UPI0009BD132A|nr:phage antirepressor N-terminal domain-containing protein [Pseudomonas chlororaphis]